jgi:hypothetical protein
MFLDALELRDSLVTIQQRADPSTGLPPVTSTAFGTIETTNANVTSVLGTIGLKYNPVRSVLISAHLIATMNDRGLRRRLTPVFGLDYSF